MKIIMFILAASIALTSHAGGWEGSKVKIEKGTLLCTYYKIEKALLLNKAGDTDSIDAFIKQGSCTFAPSDFYAVVTKDASTFTEPALAEISIKGIEMWGAMDDMVCCFK